MPLKLVAPRKGKSPNYSVRGTYLRTYVDRSTGTGEKRVAKQVLAQIKGDIERGTFGRPTGPTFLTAAVAYIQAGGQATYLPPLMKHFAETPLSEIDQKAIDDAAQALYPKATNATRNRHAYTPTSAVLKRAGVALVLKRPHGSGGVTRTEWLYPEQAFRLFQEADKIDPEFGLFLRFLTYTGLRLSEALQLRWQDVRLDEGFAYVADTKNRVPRPVYLPGHLVMGLEVHRSVGRKLAAGTVRDGSGRLFRYRKSGRLYNLLREVKTAAGLPNANFHMIGRHTYATWMRRYAGLDVRGLVATGAWKDSQAAERYAHAVTTEEARKAALLPVEDEK